jgi:hypothetical protein
MLKLKLYFDLTYISLKKNFRAFRDGINFAVSRQICVTEAHRWTKHFPPLKVSRYYLFPAVSRTKAGNEFIGKVGMLLEDLLLMFRFSELERSSRLLDYHNSSHATVGMNSQWLRLSYAC